MSCSLDCSFSVLQIYGRLRPVQSVHLQGGGIIAYFLDNSVYVLLYTHGGYLKKYTSFAKLSIDVAHDLFLKTQSPNHCLNHLLPVCRPLETVRPRGHNYFLPEYCTELHKRSFIINSLYRFV